MIQEIFGSLLEELGKVLKLQLTPDKNNSCQIKYKSGLTVQIEHDTTGEKIIMVSTLGTPAPGRYSENLLKEAAKANGLPPPQPGVFCYSKKAESLVLYGYIPLLDLTGEKLADYLGTFTQRAELWKNGMGRGEIPSYLGTELSFGAGGSGLFGLR